MIDTLSWAEKRRGEEAESVDRHSPRTVKFPGRP